MERFTAHVGAIVEQAFHKNTACFLEQPEWSALYRSISKQTPELTERNPCAVELRIIHFATYCLINSVAEIVNATEEVNETKEAEAIARLWRTNAELNHWFITHRGLLAWRPFAPDQAGDIIARSKIAAVGMGTRAFILRLIATVVESKRLQLEVMIQRSVQRILWFRQIMQNPPFCAWLRTAEHDSIAQPYIETAEEWREDLSRATVAVQKAKARERFNAWRLLMQRNLRKTSAEYSL